jgi:hypothetical protein
MRLVHKVFSLLVTALLCEDLWWALFAFITGSAIWAYLIGFVFVLFGVDTSFYAWGFFLGKLGFGTLLLVAPHHFGSFLWWLRTQAYEFNRKREYSRIIKSFQNPNHRPAMLIVIVTTIAASFQALYDSRISPIVER